MTNQILLWIGFNILIIAMLALDFLIFHRRAHEIKVREALLMSAFWISLALLFNLGIYFWRGSEVALQFFTGYLIEKSLSVDNLFVFLLIFTYFAVPPSYQHKVLFWGILGALVMRAIFILAGITLIQKFHWVIYVFGAFLLLTGVRMVSQKETKIRPEKNPIIRLFRQVMPVSDEYREEKFFLREAGRLIATPLIIVLIAIETTDVIFAVDSIPAILAITLDPFIVYSSNVCAILGLRALYFALAGVMKLFHFLHYGLSAILVFIGIKMILTDVLTIPIGISLATVGIILLISVAMSVVIPPKTKTSTHSSSSSSKKL